MMYTRKYYFKGSDLLKARKFFFQLLLTLFVSLAGIMMVFVFPAYSLSWGDKEWVQSGCPKTATGKWISENSQTLNSKSLSINDESVIFISHDEKRYQYEVIKNSYLSGNNYKEMILTPLNNPNGKEKIIKIRPHRVRTFSNNQKNMSNCFIKVFQFDSHRHAKFDKYSSWDIYVLGGGKS
jgi:hypothetical protein